MKTVLILRHAKSSWKNAALSDHERPLNKRGMQDAPRMGKLLRAEELVPELIISSTAERALKTAKLLAATADYEGEIETTRIFYHGAPEDYVARLRHLPDNYRLVMVVGHNPGLEELLWTLTGEEERMPTAALARVVLPINHWMALSEDTEGQLLDLWRPKEWPA